MCQRATIERAAQLLAQCRHAVVFSGAGISAESGVPTYRGHGGATWSKYDPSRYANIENFFSEPEYYWSFFKEVRAKVLTRCRPNAGHHAIVDLEQHGSVRTVITQNIDGLHGEAGSKYVLELHGNTRVFDCLECGSSYGLEKILALQNETLVPRCVGCGGPLKPRVVFFGEALDGAVLQAAAEEAERCDLMLVVGSTLQVYPAAGLPARVVERNQPLIIVNLGPTALDGLATCRLEGPAAEILPRICESVLGGSGP
jgi:NAD-dependent deacetylase